MYEDNAFNLTEYDKGTLFKRKAYMPLVVYFGKKEYSYWITMPPTDNKSLDNEWFQWFHNDFVDIVNHIVQKRNIILTDGQKLPSKAGGKYGWYVPIGVILELQKMWAEERVPMTFELLRPTDTIYGKGWTKQDIESIIENYLKNK